VLSADATPGRISALLEQGAAEYLPKPLDVRRFLEVLDEHLRTPATVV
jgi:DNA-binding response OmpR family regulator